MLIAVIGIVFLSGHFMSVWQRSTCAGYRAEEEEAMRKEYEEFMASIEKAEKAGKWRHAEERRNAAYGRKEETLAALSAFNPNTADSATLRKLGLPGWMAKNILRYREKGGRFRKAEDFKKVYGMTEERYTVLSPYIEIAPEDTVRNAWQLHIPPVVKVPKNEKYAAGTVLNLNLADTTELKKIPGIGSGIARLIVGRRKMLGGFYRIEQLKEIHLNVDSLRGWFSIRTEDIQRINVNRAGVERLRAHPYINFYQAKAIVEYRRKKGKLKSLKPFALYEEFTEEDLERMGHYVCFE